VAARAAVQVPAGPETQTTPRRTADDPPDGPPGEPAADPTGPGRHGMSRRRFLGGLLAAAGGLAAADRLGLTSAAAERLGLASTTRQLPLPKFAQLPIVPPIGPGNGLPKIVGLGRGAGADGRALPGGMRWRHAVGDPRGSDVVAVFGRAKEARFGTMFRDLQAFAPDDKLLTDLAHTTVEARDVADDIVPDGLDNLDVPSGFIYLGQFIDHDMTRDTTPLSVQNSDPHALTNFDTPRFDLASIYGNGPVSNPELYEADRKHPS
jgi:hypothetical protein